MKLKGFGNHDYAKVLNLILPYVLINSGCCEMLMAEAVINLAAKTPGKEAVAMESFAKALRMASIFCFHFQLLFTVIFVKFRILDKFIIPD